MSVATLLREEPGTTPVPVVVEDGIGVSEGDREAQERDQYETGLADTNASRVAGPYHEPWLNVLAHCEPGTPPALEAILEGPLSRRVRGQVVDLGCGTGWSVARLSRVPTIDCVMGIDLSRRFLETVTRRVIATLSGEPAKIRLVAGTFEHIPLPDGTLDAAFLIAAIHHALSPRRVLREVLRTLKTDGRLFVIEAPAPGLLLRRARRASIAETERSGASEIAYSLGELTYLLEWSGFDIETVSLAPCPPSRTKLRQLVRWCLRTSGVERLAAIPTRIIVARPRRTAS